MLVLALCLVIVIVIVLAYPKLAFTVNNFLKFAGKVARVSSSKLQKRH